jgi:hypothetical protein
MSLRDSCRGGQPGSRAPSFEAMPCACACLGQAAAEGQVSLQQKHLGPTPAILHQRLELSLGLSRRCLDFTPGLAVRWRRALASPFCAGASSMFLAFSSASCMRPGSLSLPSVGISCGSASTSCLASRCVHDASASDFASVALSVSPAGSTRRYPRPRLVQHPRQAVLPIICAR